MLFNSYIFMLVFLPVVVAGFYGWGKMFGQGAAFAWLLVSSFFFYGYWHPPYLALLLISILANYGWSLLIDHAGGQKRRLLAAVGIAGNLAILGYYKYALFLLETILSLSGKPRLDLPEITLPIGISFYTFQQIAYLCDIRDHPSGVRYSLPRYAFFISFFPQLIAGPIVHHHELLPQLRNRIARFRLSRFAPGVALFLIGLCKKAVFADRMAPLANGLFDSGHATPGFTDSWVGASAYSLQLYFDFSGYSDMACGLALMFNLRLPINFASPYQAKCIIEFWRRWHLTLSRFLRDYLYIPLGGSRGTPWRRTTTLLITMLLGGLWHGAGWTFILWGGLHGLALAVNHAWRGHRKARGASLMPPTLSQVLTLLCVTSLWILFRSADLDTAFSILKGMAGCHGIGGLELIESKANQLGLMAALWMVVLFAPSGLTMLRRYRPGSGDPFPLTAKSRLEIRTGMLERPWAALSMAVIFLGILLNMPRVSEFIYFQF